MLSDKESKLSNILDIYIDNEYCTVLSIKGGPDDLIQYGVFDGDEYRIRLDKMDSRITIWHVNIYPPFEINKDTNSPKWVRMRELILDAIKELKNG